MYVPWMYTCNCIDVPGEGGCESDTDTTWGIFWPATENNATAVAACPGGSSVVG